MIQWPLETVSISSTYTYNYMICNDTLICLTNIGHTKLLPCWSLLAIDCNNHVRSNSFIHLPYLFCHLYDMFRRSIIGYVALVIINAICTNWGKFILPIYNIYLNKCFIKNSRKVCLQKIEHNEMYCKYIKEHHCNNVSAVFIVAACIFDNIQISFANKCTLY